MIQNKTLILKYRKSCPVFYSFTGLFLSYVLVQLNFKRFNQRMHTAVALHFSQKTDKKNYELA